MKGGSEGSRFGFFRWQPELVSEGGLVHRRRGREIRKRMDNPRPMRMKGRRTAAVGSGA
jgi:hypothetical protein